MSEYPTISKRQAHHQLLQYQSQDQDHPDQPLLPGLPDHIAHLCLSNVPPSTLFNICLSWRRLIYAPSFPPFLSLYTILSSSSSSDSNSNSSIHFFSFDPISSNWHPLPPPPPDPPLRFLLHHPSFLSRSLPIQSVSVSGKLILLAATTHNFHPALTRPLIFDPILRKWTYGPELVKPRRWCAAGSLGNAVYVASGMGSQFSSDVAKSVEKWSLEENTNNNDDHNNSKWEKVRELKNGRFSREAIDAVGWKGKFCVVNVKGVEGILYDVFENKWEEMAEGMVKGWRGPVAAMGEEVMYVIDENNGSLRRYVEGMDDWVEIVKSELLKGAKYVAAGGGRVCAICGRAEVGGGSKSKIVVVNVTAVPAEICVVDTPLGFEALTLHILPRMGK